MLYTDFATIIETHMDAIGHQIALQAIARRVPGYADVPVERLAELVRPTVSMIARYIRNGDPAEYRDHATQLTETRMREGYDTKYLITMGQIMDSVLNATIAQQLPGAEHAEARAIFARRLAVIEQLGDSAVVMARLKGRTPQ